MRLCRFVHILNSCITWQYWRHDKQNKHHVVIEISRSCFYQRFQSCLTSNRGILLCLLVFWIESTAYFSLMQILREWIIGFFLLHNLAVAAIINHIKAKTAYALHCLYAYTGFKLFTRRSFHIKTIIIIRKMYATRKYIQKYVSIGCSKRVHKERKVSLFNNAMQLTQW